VVVIDDLTVSDPEHPVLVIDIAHEPGRVFRAVPQLVVVIEHYLSAGDARFADFAELVDQDGIARGW
jgi:hypothetical protein